MEIASQRGGRRRQTCSSGRAVTSTTLHELPFPVAATTASGTVTVEFPTVAINHLREIAAEPASAIIFAIGYDIAPVGPAVPIITPADGAGEAVVIGTRGIGPVVAIHVAADGVASQAAQQRAADNAEAIAMAGKT